VSCTFTEKKEDVKIKIKVKKYLSNFGSQHIPDVLELTRLFFSNVALPSMSDSRHFFQCYKSTFVKLQNCLLPQPGTDVMNFKNIFAEKFGEIIGVCCPNHCWFGEKLDHNIGKTPN
jgi:hypothetical protein